MYRAPLVLALAAAVAFFFALPAWIWARWIRRNEAPLAELAAHLAQVFGLLGDVLVNRRALGLLRYIHLGGGGGGHGERGGSGDHFAQ